jgi:hypothetical protein
MNDKIWSVFRGLSIALLQRVFGDLSGAWRNGSPETVKMAAVCAAVLMCSTCSAQTRTPVVLASEVSASFIVTDLATALAGAGSSQATLNIAQVVAVSANTVVPEDVTLKFSRGGMLDIAGGVTLTINGGIEAGLYQIFTGAGTVAGDLKVEAVYPEWFYCGAYGSESADWSPAINKSIDLANSGCKKVKLQARRYNVLSTVNLANSTVNKADMTLEGAVRSTQYERGTLLVGNTGEGKCVIETTDSDGTHLKNIGVVRGSVNPSSIGILQARGTGTGWAGDQYHENVYVNMSSNPSSNSGFGTIGIINLAGEETRWENLQVWANMPLVITWTNSFQRTSGDMSSIIGCGVTSSVGANMATNASDTVFKLSGLGRLIAYDYVSPCLLINAAATVDLGHVFLQMRPSGVSGVTQGVYKYAIENWNCYQFKHFGAIEGAGGYLLDRRDLTDADINVRMSGNGETTQPLDPLIYLYDDGGDYSFARCKVNLNSYDSGRPLFAARRIDGSNTAPMRFTIQDSEFKTGGAYNMTTFRDKRILRNTINSAFNFGDGRRIRVGDHTIVMPISKNIGVRGQATDLFRVRMPTYISNLGAFSVSVSLEGSLSNAIGGGVGDPSVNSFKCNFNIANQYNSQTITVSTIGVTNDSPANTNVAANSITGVQITAVADNANNWVTVRAQPVTTGANNAAVQMNAEVTSIWSGGYRDTLVIEPL